jgi:hypothetical protein
LPSYLVVLLERERERERQRALDMRERRWLSLPEIETREREERGERREERGERREKRA